MAYGLAFVMFPMTISNAQTRKRHSVWICLRHVSMEIRNVSTHLKHAKACPYVMIRKFSPRALSKK